MAQITRVDANARPPIGRADDRAAGLSGRRFERPAQTLVHILPTPEVYDLLASRPGGLTQGEVAERLQHYGSNVIREIKGTPLILKFLLAHCSGDFFLFLRVSQDAESLLYSHSSENLCNGIFLDRHALSAETGDTLVLATSGEQLEQDWCVEADGDHFIRAHNSHRYLPQCANMES